MGEYIQSGRGSGKTHALLLKVGKAMMKKYTGTPLAVQEYGDPDGE